MMSNSTLPLGFLHSLRPTVSLCVAVGFYFDIALTVEFLLICTFGGCDEVDKFHHFTADISQNLSNLFFYCYKCLIHSNSDAKVQNILETKEDFEKKQKNHEIIMKRFAFHVSKCENYCSNNYIIIIYINI